jgi:DNA-binding CsgD family transcriptional regulator
VAIQVPQPLTVLPSMLKNKHRPPLLSPQTIDRHHLDPQSWPPTADLVTVIAPAGYGKTIVLAQWRAHFEAQGQPTAWLTMDQDDADPINFLNSLETALAASLPAAEAPSNNLVQHIAEIVGTCGALTLFLDDFDRGQSTAVNESGLPKFRLIVAARTHPEIPVARMRASSRLVELTTRDLQFTDCEASRLLDLEEAVARPLIMRAQGWPAALLLGRIWLDRCRDADTRVLVEQFSGSVEEVSDYLAEAVFQTLEPAAQQLAVDCAILDQVCGPLADAITGRNDSTRQLRQLDRGRHLIQRVEEPSGWYVFHQLFRDFLKTRLAGEDAARLRNNQLLAARWFHAAGLPLQAIEHALCAGDTELAGQIMVDAGGLRLGLQGGEMVLDRLETLPELLLGRHPHIELGHIYALMKANRAGQARTRMDQLLKRPALQAWQTDRSSVAESRLQIDTQVANAVLAIYEDRLIDGGTVDHVAAIIAQTPGLDRTDMAQGILLRTYFCYQQRDYAAAADWGTRGAKAFLDAGAPYAAVFLYLYVGLANRGRGDLSAATAAYGKARDLAARTFGTSSIGVALAEVFAGETAVECGDVERARQLLVERHLPALEAENWPDAWAAYFLGRARLAAILGDQPGALALLGVAERRARGQTLSRLVRLFALEAAMISAKDVPLHFTAAASANDSGQCFSLCPWLDGNIVDGFLAVMNAQPEEALRLFGALPAVPADSEGSDHFFWQLIAGSAHALLGRRRAARDLLAAALGTPDGRQRLRPLLVLADLLRDNLQELSHSTDKPVADAASAVLRLCDRQGDDRDRPVPLTAREQEVLSLLQLGFSTKEMSRALGISDGTVKIHRKNLYSKLKVHSRSGAIAVARQMQSRSHASVSPAL